MWISVGPDRVKIYYDWEQAIYWYFHCVRAITTGEPWLVVHSDVFDMEFGITNPKARDAFIRKVKAATCFDELPFMTKRMREEIENGMRWGEEHYRQNEAWD